MKNLRQWIKGFSLQKKIMIMVLGNVVVIVLSMILFMQITVYRNMREDSIADNTQRLIQIDKNLSLILGQIAEDTLSIYTDIQKRLGASKKLLNDSRNFSVRFSNYYPVLIDSMRSYKYIHSMMLFTKDGKKYYQSDGSGKVFLQEDLFRKTMDLVNEDRIITWSKTLTEDFYFYTDAPEKIVSEILEIKVNYQTEALFVVNIYEEELEQLIADSQENEHLVLQLGEEDCIFHLNEEDEVSEKALRSMVQDLQRDNFVNRNHYYVFTEENKVTGWLVSLVYAKRRIDENSFESISGLLVVIAVFAIGILCINTLIVRDVTRPINRVTKDIIHSAETGELVPISFVPRTNDEVSSLVHYYNHLIEKILDDRKKIEEEQNLRNTMYLQMLQMQINPHFLYNTLATLKCLILMKDEKAEEMVNAIGDFYKGSLIDTNDVTSMKEEIRHVESYLKIMKLRYQKKIHYAIHADENLMDRVILKLSLQPVVENAILHGLQRKRGAGNVEITVYREGKTIRIDVYDDGVGIPPEKLREIQNSLRDVELREERSDASHIGLLNVNKRIQLRFGREYGLWIESEEGIYTRIRYILPDADYYKN